MLKYIELFFIEKENDIWAIISNTLLKTNVITWNYHLKNKFGQKIFKVALDGGFDCPNRDGTVAHGGCTLCCR